MSAAARIASFADAEQLARRRLPPAMFENIVTGTGKSSRCTVSSMPSTQSASARAPRFATRPTEGGKIRRIREYANPVTSAIAFGLPLPQSSDDGVADGFV